MSRTEENKNMIKNIKETPQKDLGVSDNNTYLTVVMTTILMDISKSLAIIADNCTGENK